MAKQTNLVADGGRPMLRQLQKATPLGGVAARNTNTADTAVRTNKNKANERVGTTVARPSKAQQNAFAYGALSGAKAAVESMANKGATQKAKENLSANAGKNKVRMQTKSIKKGK